MLEERQIAIYSQLWLSKRCKTKMSLRLAYAGPWKSKTIFQPAFSFSGACRAPLFFLCLIFSLWDLKLLLFLLSFLCLPVVHVYLHLSSATTLSLHLPSICLVFRHPFGCSRALSFTPAVAQLPWQAPGSGGLRAGDGQSATLTSYETSQVLPSLSRLPSVNEKMPPGCCGRKAAQSVRHEGAKDLTPKIPNSPCEPQGVPVELCLLWDVDCAQ